MFKSKKTSMIKSKLIIIMFLLVIIMLYTGTYAFTYSEYTTVTTLSEVENATGIVDNSVVLDEFLSDYNYYMGLNYTESYDGILPDGSNQKLYSDSNLVKTIIYYNGYSIDDENKRGYVSLDERQDTYIYYKYYPVVDGYINIELIDNPFTARPNDMGFNGWITDYQGAIISYDDTYYSRYAKIPVTMTNNLPTPIEINFYASWYNANVGILNNNWSSAFSNLKEKGFQEIGGTRTIYEDVTGLYIYGGVVNRNTNYPNDAISNTGQNVGGTRCRTNGGCTYYLEVTSNVYDENATYYKLTGNNNNRRMQEYEVQIIGYETGEYLEEDTPLAGFYDKKDVPYGNSIVGLYDENAIYQESGTCTNRNGCSYYELFQYYDSDGNILKAAPDTIYYYLVTRDMNIIYMNSDINSTWDSSQNKPFTLTSLHNGVDNSSNVDWTISNIAINCYNDTRIENVKIVTNQGNSTSSPSGSANQTRYFYGNYYNVKIGRGILKNNNYKNFNGVIGGNNNTSALGNTNDVTKYRIVVESGFYNTLTLTNGASTTNRNKYIEGIAQYGNDYDRASKNNDNLDVYYVAAGSWGNGNYYASTNEGITFNTVVKSGRFGSQKGTDHTVGIYIGGRSYGTHYTSRQVKVEGGWIYNLIGGPLTANNRGNINDTYVFMTGGEVDMIIGGAGTSATYGNRIISLTGGTVNYSVFGGSNGYDGDSSDGTLNGSSFVYVGGNVTVGNKQYVDNNNTLWGAEAGSVFGIGNGKAGTDTIGSNDNSNIVIDNKAVILNNVYGGGNHGATGISSTSNSNTTNINIHGGTIEGSVYGGGNNNGAGSSTKTASVNINMDDGIVNGSIYGGSKNKGTVYGNIDLNILKGSILTSVYGGGEGGYTSANNIGTFVTGSVDVAIGQNEQENDLLKINNSVYGGSAFGTVNGNSADTTISSNNTSVVVNSGRINNVYGGGEGNNTYTPYVKGNVTVDINGGIINNVYGGNDLKGTPNGKVVVNIKGGEVENAYAGGNQTIVEEPYINLLGGTIIKAFGGGNNAKVTTSHVLLQGSNVENIFGGSNEAGAVNTSNIIANSGIATNIFGGNNIGGTTNITNVKINSGKIKNVYGGGEKTDVTSSTNIELYGIVENLFGGSDTEGEVNASFINIHCGVASNVYGGNNLGGSTTTSNITVEGGILENVFGGGLQANTNASNINVVNGKIVNLYGGGSKAGVNTTHVNLANGHIDNVYGGSNETGDVGTSNIKNTDTKLENSNILITNTFSNSNINQSGATDIKSSETIKVVIENKENVSISNWDFYLVTKDSILDSNWSGATIEEVNGIFHVNEVSQWYGTNPINANDSYSFEFNIHSYVEYDNFEIIDYMFIGYDDNGNIYKVISSIDLSVNNLLGGNNLGGVTDVALVDLTKGEYGTIYGGGNKAVTNNPSVSLSKVKVRDTVYGGGNEALITTDTIVDITDNSTILGSVYGGGNAGVVNDGTSVAITESTVNNVYGGGNKGEVLKNTNVTINNSTILENIYGGGNEAAINKNTIVNISTSKITNNVFGGGNNGLVLGTTSTLITNSSIGSSVYAGGNGNTAIVAGNNLINVEGNTTVTNHIFGGGNAAASGCNQDITDKEGNVVFVCNNPNASKSEVNIAGAIINGNVYGGANTSVVYGESFVNIGISTIDSSYNLNKGNIQIKGTVFGGGEANASGSPDYDFEFISITKGININIDASNHDTYTITGSIFGSGNASSSGGYSYINIKNYGTMDDYQHNISIQRTDVVTIDNSAIELDGTTDRTNKYDDYLFSLSRIKHLKLKNGSTLYLNNGANLLEKYSSLVDIDGKEVLVSVDIDAKKNKVIKNGINRIYMKEGINLVISDDESLATYGDIEGMTFFGMHKKDRNGVIETALYSTEYEPGEEVNGSILYYFSSGSYVRGKHKDNHDYYKDGFYTNYANEDGTSIIVDYIEPTPPDSIHYDWSIGEKMAEIVLETLTASKYATLGTKDLQLTDYSNPNTTIHILGVNFDELVSDIELLESSDIPRHADTEEKANTNFGLGIETGTNGWITKGNTEFVTVGNKDIIGTTTYKKENSVIIPNLVFYLYHSKNLTESRDLGRVIISIMVVTPVDDLNDKIERLNIVVPIATKYFEGDFYEGTITPGAKYEMFANSNVNITSKSSFSTYYSLYTKKDTTPYKNGSYRTLTSSYALPVNTKITMIDFASSEKPEYYYYVINQTDYNNSVLELTQDGEISYPLARFIKMGSSSTDNTYKDDLANSKYYNSNEKKVEEEFIFIVDLKDASINADVLNKNLLLELRDSNDSPIIPMLDRSQEKISYNLYVNRDALINATVNLNSDSLYVGSSVVLTVVTDFEQQQISGVNIIDTNFYDKKLGIKLSLYTEDGDLVNGATLLGTKFIYDDAIYFSRQDGTVRFNIAESIANVSSKITIDATNSNIPSGNYKLLIETFGSSDGIYYGLNSSTNIEKDIIIVNERFGLKASMSEEDVIIDKDSGLTEDGDNRVQFDFSYESNIKNANVRVSLYRRTYSDVYEYTYELVDLSNYVTTDLIKTNNPSEYLVRSNPNSSFSYSVNLKEDLISGTYKVIFSLYDGNNYIGDITKYIIIE